MGCTLTECSAKKGKKAKKDDDDCCCDCDDCKCGKEEKKEKKSDKKDDKGKGCGCGCGCGCGGKCGGKCCIGEKCKAFKLFGKMFGWVEQKEDITNGKKSV